MGFNANLASKIFHFSPNSEPFFAEFSKVSQNFQCTLGALHTTLKNHQKWPKIWEEKWTCQIWVPTTHYSIKLPTNRKTEFGLNRSITSLESRDVLFINADPADTANGLFNEVSLRGENTLSVDNLERKIVKSKYCKNVIYLKKHFFKKFVKSKYYCKNNLFLKTFLQKIREIKILQK